jgi:hypothetical protein
VGKFRHTRADGMHEAHAPSTAQQRSRQHSVREQALPTSLLNSHPVLPGRSGTMQTLSGSIRTSCPGSWESGQFPESRQLYFFRPAALRNCTRSRGRRRSKGQDSAVITACRTLPARQTLPEVPPAELCEIAKNDNRAVLRTAANRQGQSAAARNARTEFK